MQSQSWYDINYWLIIKLNINDIIVSQQQQKWPEITRADVDLVCIDTIKTAECLKVEFQPNNKCTK